MEIWCVENVRYVLLSKSLHGKFYCRNAYVVFNVCILAIFDFFGTLALWCVWLEVKWDDDIYEPYFDVTCLFL